MAGEARGIAVAVMVFLFPTLHFGSVFPQRGEVDEGGTIFTGVLLTSNIALKCAPMAMVVVFRVLLLFLSMEVESGLPVPPRITRAQLLPVTIMVSGNILYASGAHTEHLLDGVAWIVLNMLLAVGDRVVQRSMLAADQHPMDSPSRASHFSTFSGGPS